MTVDTWPDNPYIYYWSHNNIDQLYRAYFGPPEKEIVKAASEIKGSEHKAALGLGQLIEIAGLEASGSSSLSEEESESINVTQKITEMDIAIEMAELLFNDLEISDVKNVREGGISNSFYKFVLPIRANKPDMDYGEFIEITHDSEEYHITGITSRDNWVSSSFTAEILQIAGKEDVRMSGILHPVSINKEDGDKLNIQAQYLLLCSAATGE